MISKPCPSLPVNKATYEDPKHDIKIATVDLCLMEDQLLRHGWVIRTAIIRVGYYFSLSKHDASG